jgi:xanthine dehydrogenase accessory factor
MSLRVLIRGGGDLASGAALRLVRSGAQVVITELAMPQVVRRAASYANAVYERFCKVEETRGRLCADFSEVAAALENREVPVIIDPEAAIRHSLQPHVIIDARMTKREPDIPIEAAPLVIGLGPGFIVGIHCHAIVETKRGHTLGRVYWTGTAEADTQVPEQVSGIDVQRVLRAPAAGEIKNLVRIGDLVVAGQDLAIVGGKVVKAGFDGVVRGLIADGFPVQAGMKIGDLDPRQDPRLCFIVSDKSLAVGGGVLEAILSRADLRGKLCSHN